VPPRRLAVLDASAVLAWVLKEQGRDVVAKLLPRSVIPASVLVETLYRAHDKGHKMSAAELRSSVVAMGVSVEPLLDDDTVRAAELIIASHTGTHRQAGSLSLGDGLCIATAERLNLPLIGNDRFWSSSEAQGIGIKVEVKSFRDTGARSPTGRAKP
jgi:ribonuclease VapC